MRSAPGFSFFPLAHSNAYIIVWRNGQFSDWEAIHQGVVEDYE
jgi:hypothetical protein